MVFFVAEAHFLLFSDAVLGRMTRKATGAGAGTARANRYQAVIPAQQIGIWRTVDPMAGNAHDNGAIRITICEGVACQAG